MSLISKLTSSSNDVIHKIMDNLDLDDLECVSFTCKSLNYDSKKYCEKYKKEKINKLIVEHTCRNCDNLSYFNERQVCLDCYIHMCENCYTIRNYPNEFIKTPIDVDDLCLGYRKVCHDYCIYRCYKCRTCDVQSNMFLNDYVNFKTICACCYIELPDDDKKLFDSITGGIDNDFDNYEQL